MSIGFNLIDAQENLDYLVLNHFCDLRKVSVRLNKLPLSETGRIAITYHDPMLQEGYVIALDPRFLSNANQPIVRGLLAHELGHVEQMKFFGLFDKSLYAIIRRMPALNDFYERVADKIAEKRGCKVYLDSLDIALT